MNAKHTPGPWFFDPEEIAVLAPDKTPHFFNIIADLGDIFHEESGEYDPQETEANGRLIAAAPDLLHSLEKILIEFRQLSLGNLKNDETSENHRCKVFDLQDTMYWNALTIIKQAKGL